MELFMITYSVINQKEFTEFIFLLEQTTKHNLNMFKDDNINISDSIISKALSVGFSESLAYFSTLESVHAFSHTAKRSIYRIWDVTLINEMCNRILKEYEEERIDYLRDDIVLLLTAESMYYYMLAWSDSLHDSPFHVEDYKHIWFGIKAAWAQGKLSAIYTESNNSKMLEVFRRRANALRDINLMILLYLYSMYKTVEDIKVVSMALIWLLNSGYEWFHIPAETKEEILLQFLFWTVPENALGFPKGMSIYEIYDTISKYNSSIHERYPDAGKDFRNLIENLKDLPKVYRDWE